MISETIKAKASQRLRRRLSCHLRVSLSPLRNTIVPLLQLLLDVSVDVSYPFLSPLNLFSVHTGLRQGEMLGLKWTDIDLDAGKLSVHRSLKVTEDGLDFGPPKNKASRRSVPLNKTAVVTLRAHRLRQNEERLSAPDGSSDGSGPWQSYLR